MRFFTAILWASAVLKTRATISVTDAAIIGVSAQNDFANILALRDWAPGDVLFLTADEINSDGSIDFIISPDVWRFTVPPEGVGAGDTVFFNVTEADGWMIESTGTGIDINENGEELSLFTGSIPSPSYVYSMVTEASFSAASSNVPPGLVLGFTALALDGGHAFYDDNGVFTVLDLLSRISDRSNWRFFASGIDRDTFENTVQFIDLGGGNIQVVGTTESPTSLSPTPAPTRTQDSGWDNLSIGGKIGVGIIMAIVILCIAPYMCGCEDCDTGDPGDCNCDCDCNGGDCGGGDCGGCGGGCGGC